MNTTLYTYVTDYLQSFGLLGEHGLTFTARIESEENRFGPSYSCEILKVFVDFQWPDGTTASVDVTQAFTTKEFIRLRYQDEILRHYKASFNRDVV